MENAWPRIALEAVRGLLEVPPAEPGTGMFSWGEPGPVRGLLSRAGFADIAVVPVDAPIELGATPAEAAEFALLFGPVSRLLAGLDAGRIDALRAALEEAFAARGTRVPGAFQIVLARA